MNGSSGSRFARVSRLVSLLPLQALAPLMCGCEDARPPVAPAAIAPASAASGTSAIEPAQQPMPSEAERTLKRANALRRSAEEWRRSHPSECPTAARLADDKALSPKPDQRDAWGTPFKIFCDEDSTFVMSLGPDRREGTTDDLRDGAAGTTNDPAPPATTATTSTPATNVRPPSASQQWGASEVTTVVRAHTAALRRTCWDRDAAAYPANASVVLTMIIAPDGNVQNTTFSGDQGVGTCIAQQAATWRFPAPGVATTVNIPFRFVAP